MPLLSSAGRALAVVAYLVVAGCSGPPTGLEADLPGTAWTLERVVFADGSVERGTGERIAFQPDGRVLLTSCNTCNGTYRLRGDRLTVRSPLACTRRACAPGTLELEAFFETRRTVRRDGTYLIVEGGEGAQLLFLPVSETAPAASTR